MFPVHAVQMTAVSVLSTLVDDWNFSDTQFVECVGPVMTLLVQLLGNAVELDSQTQVRERVKHNKMFM